MVKNILLFLLGVIIFYISLTYKQTKTTTTMTTITFGTGNDSVIHVIPSDKTDEYLKDLANAGWKLSEITSIKKD